MKKTLLILVGIFLFFGVISESTAAQKLTGVTISPALLDVTLSQPNEEKRLPFVLQNNTQTTLTFELYPIDFKQGSEYGGISFLGQNIGGYSYSLSSFLSFEVSSLTLLPGEKQIFYVTAKNRGDLSPGGHYAAVIARLVQENRETSFAPAVSSLILLRKKGGERYNLSLLEIDWPKQTFNFGYKRSMQLLFQNEGNVHLTPYGRVEIRDIFGRVVYDGVINNNSSRVMPESRRYLFADIKTTAFSFPLSVNRIAIRGQDSLHKTNFLYDDTFVYIHPMLLGLPIGIGVFILIRRRSQIRSTKHETRNKYK